MVKKITNSQLEKNNEQFSVGQEVFLSGVVYTMRDQAHKRLCDALKKRKTIPLDLRGKIIYYCGPTKTPPGKVIGSCGPTTSSRMDLFTPLLLKHGVKGVIGKGERSREVIDALRRYKAVYFLAPAGCGALLAKKVTKVMTVAYADLGPEAIRKIEVNNFPLIVAVDTRGRSIYDAK